MFSTCIECFDYIHAGRSFSKDFEILLAKLDVEKTRLLIWSDAVGLLKPPSDGRATELEDLLVSGQIERCLLNIKSLLTNSDELVSRYGLTKDALVGLQTGKRELVSFNSMNLFRASYARFRVSVKEHQQRTDLGRLTRWAIHDREKFEKLLDNLIYFVDALGKLVPERQASQDAVFRTDLESLPDLSSLKLLEKACEPVHHAWSKAASVLIEASEIDDTPSVRVQDWVATIPTFDEWEDKEDDASSSSSLIPSRKRAQVIITQPGRRIEERAEGENDASSKSSVIPSTKRGEIKFTKHGMLLLLASR